MACLVDAKSAFAWPSLLSRVLDRDAGFRRAACLAAARYCEMRYPGQDWMASILGGAPYDVYYPPDRDPSPRALHASHVLGSLFGADGGVEYVSGGGNDLFEYEFGPGQFVFSDVQSRSHGPYVRVTSGEQWASLGRPSRMAGSQYPYRMWWQALNRAVSGLIQEFPLYTGTDGDGNTYHVLPLCLSSLPDGSAAVSPGDLLVPWTALSAASGVERVPSSGTWLVTPADVDFSDRFLACGAPSNSNALRAAWRSRAAEIGFDHLVPETLSLASAPSFADSARRWWHGETGPLARDGRLAQLSGAWSGSASAWRDEFPYHGYAAFVAVLDYLETANAGFCLYSDAWDAVPVVWHQSASRIRRDATAVAFTPSFDAEQTVSTSEAQPWDTTQDELTTDLGDLTPRLARTSVVGPVTAASAAVEGLVPWKVQGLEHQQSSRWLFDSDGYDNDLLAVYVSDGLEAFRDELNRRWRNGVLYGQVEFEFSASDTCVRLSADPQFTSLAGGVTTTENGEFASFDPDITGTPFRGARCRCAAGNSYWFLRTARRARIASRAQLDLIDWPATLESELTWRGLPDQLPGPGTEPATAVVPAAPTEPFDVYETNEVLVDRAHPVVNLVLPRVLLQGRQVFPPELPVGQTTDFELGLVQVSLTGLTSSDPNDYSAYNGTDSTSLVTAKGLHFVRYPKNVLYPD